MRDTRLGKLAEALPRPFRIGARAAKSGALKGRHGPCTACAGTRMPIVTDGFAQLGWRTAEPPAGHRRVRHTELLPESLVDATDDNRCQGRVQE